MIMANIQIASKSGRFKHLTHEMQNMLAIEILRSFYPKKGALEVVNMLETTTKGFPIGHGRVPLLRFACLVKKNKWW